MCFARLSCAEYNPLNSPSHTHSEKINSRVFIEQLSLPLNSKEALCCPPADLLNFPPVFSSFVMTKAFPLEREERNLFIFALNCKSKYVEFPGNIVKIPKAFDFKNKEGLSFFNTEE